jgi:hypothetical protein
MPRIVRITNNRSLNRMGKWEQREHKSKNRHEKETRRSGRWLVLITGYVKKNKNKHYRCPIIFSHTHPCGSYFFLFLIGSPLGHQQAQELAIEPMVRTYCDKWRAYQVATQVVALRNAVQAYLQAQCHLEVDGDLATAPVAVRELLHQPMMDLRQGKYVSTEQILQQVAQIITKIQP